MTERTKFLTAEVIEGFVSSMLLKSFDGAAAIPECHREWWQMCCSPHKFVALAAPRGHAKSTAITLSYTLACLLFRERQFILLVSDTESQSSFFLNNIKREIDTNNDLKKFFHVSKFIKDTETDFIVEFEDGYQARIIAKGSEQKLRGINWDNKRPDLIVCDDMENDEIVMNKERREKFRRWFTAALLPCRSKDGIVRFVGTILHMDSQLERLMPKEHDRTVIRTELKISTTMAAPWYAAKYKAHNPSFSHILWEDYKNAAWLKAERANAVADGLGDVYSQEYLNIPIDEANSFFRKTDFGVMREEDHSKKMNYYLSTDLAVSLKQKSDYTVLTVGGIDEDGKLNIVEVLKERMDSLETINTILQLNKKYDFNFCVFEKGAISHSILPMLNMKMHEENNYVTIYDLTPTQDKMTRAQSIRARMRAGAVKFDKAADWYIDLEQECMRFPRDAHDDQVDTLSLLGQALDKFVEAPTKEEIEVEAYEDELKESHLDMGGRSEISGY